MQARRLNVLVRIWAGGGVGAWLNRFMPSSKIFLLTVPGQGCFYRSYVLFLFWFVVLLCTSVC